MPNPGKNRIRASKILEPDPNTIFLGKNRIRDSQILEPDPNTIFLGPATLFTVCTSHNKFKRIEIIINYFFNALGTEEKYFCTKIKNIRHFFCTSYQHCVFLGPTECIAGCVIFIVLLYNCTNYQTGSTVTLEKIFRLNFPPIKSRHTGDSFIYLHDYLPHSLKKILHKNSIKLYSFVGWRVFPFSQLYCPQG